MSETTTTTTKSSSFISREAIPRAGFLNLLLFPPPPLPPAMMTSLLLRSQPMVCLRERVKEMWPLAVRNIKKDNRPVICIALALSLLSGSLVEGICDLWTTGCGSDFKKNKVNACAAASNMSSQRGRGLTGCRVRLAILLARASAACSVGLGEYKNSTRDSTMMRWGPN